MPSKVERIEAKGNVNPKRIPYAIGTKELEDSLHSFIVVAVNYDHKPSIIIIPAKPPKSEIELRRTRGKSPTKVKFNSSRAKFLASVLCEWLKKLITSIFDCHMSRLGVSLRDLQIIIN